MIGISASHNGDLSGEFLRYGNACTGHSGSEEPAADAIFQHLHPEDVVFIESYTPQTGLRIKAVGVVTSCALTQRELGACVPVQWVWQGEKRIENLDDVCPERSGDVYEEWNPWVQREIMDLLPVKYRMAVA